MTPQAGAVISSFTSQGAGDERACEGQGLVLTQGARVPGSAQPLLVPLHLLQQESVHIPGILVTVAPVIALFSRWDPEAQRRWVDDLGFPDHCGRARTWPCLWLQVTVPLSKAAVPPRWAFLTQDAGKTVYSCLQSPRFSGLKMLITKEEIGY